MPTRTVADRIRDLQSQIRAWQTIDALLDQLAAAPGRPTMVGKDVTTISRRPADDHSVLRSFDGASLGPSLRGVQGCACPTCRNDVLTDGELDIAYLFCRRCYRAACDALHARHDGPRCTMPDCPHMDHL